MECWIPEEEEMRPGEDWREYEQRLYGLFKLDFLDSSPMYDGLPVRVRVNPKYGQLITAYHVDEEWSRRNIMREAEKNGAVFVEPCR